MINSLVILGSTGSIGRQALEVCARLHITINALAAGENVALLVEQIEQFAPKVVAVKTEALAQELEQRLFGRGIVPPSICFGAAGYTKVALVKADMLLAAMSGFAGLQPVLEAVADGRDIALANKECLVVAGKLLLDRARANNCQIYPVDSEHSAIWQCLAAVPRSALRRLWLTASGGPFWTKSAAYMAQVKPSEALRHPLWQMGAKISIDSATMMNKGLELIEACHLFQVRAEDISIVVHPEGVIHSLIELNDGELLAQLGKADMRLAIQLAFTWPERVDASWGRFDFFSPKHSSLSFHRPDLQRFPALVLAANAMEAGGLQPLVLNAANEVGVAAYLAGQIAFPRITELCAEALSHFSQAADLTDYELDDIITLNELVQTWAWSHK